MPERLSGRALAGRVEQDARKRINRFRKATWWTALGCGLLAGGWLAYSGARGDHRLYEGGALSTPHKIIANRCAECHTAWTPIQRLARIDNALHSISNDKCLRCHAAPPHNMGQVPAHHEISCAACHREHQGDHVSLASIDDAHCIRCHADLRTADGPTIEFVSRITSFGDHPEFALRRQHAHGNERPGGTELAPTRHNAVERAFLELSGETWSWTDRAALRFNHEFHLRSDGLPVPPSHPEYGDGKTWKRLECRDCHVRDAEGRYMQPIAYERHCSQCHRLEFSRELSEPSSPAAAGPLPHVGPQLIRGILRDRLMAHVEAHPELLAAAAPAEAERPALPHKKPAATLAPSAKDKWDWVERRLADAEAALFKNVKHGCTHCHVVEPAQAADAETASPLLNWRIVPPNIPQRWLPHSRFRHDRHDIIRCTDCHDPTIARENAAGNDDTTVIHSRSTADILMPSIEVCRKCHGREAAVSSGSAARANCVECHQYHHSRGFIESRPLEEFLGGVRADVR